MVFPGHVNTHRNDLGVAVDPSCDFLFAAGEDCVIRAWSLRSGEPLHDSRHGLFPSVDGVVNTLQVTDGPFGLRVWASYGSDVRAFDMGVPETW